MTRLLFACLLAAAFAAPSLAQEPETSPPTPVDAQSDVDVVTVIGRPRDNSMWDIARDFVTEIGDPPSTQVGYARWDDPICVGVVNAPAESAQYVADRISEVALELDLRVQEPDCSPNIVIFFDADATALAAGLVEERPEMFFPFHGTSGTTQGRAALEDFATTDAPVRWWQVSMVVDWRGRLAFDTPTAPRSGSLSPLNSGPVIAGANSNILNSTKDELGAAYIIVDTSKVAGFTWTQLADYLAMVSLAQIDPHSNADGYSSILNLFSGSAPDGMTDWDWSYLKALYELDRRLFPRAQRGALARELVRNQEED